MDASSKPLVYGVWEGEYSDRHLVAVFSTREDAETCRALLERRHEEPDVEEHELDPELAHWRAGLSPYWVQLDAATGALTNGNYDDGGVRKTGYPPSRDPYLHNAHSHRDCPRTPQGRHDFTRCLFRDTPARYDEWTEAFNQYRYRAFEVEVWARDETHAVKIAHERWAQWQALTNGV